MAYGDSIQMYQYHTLLRRDYGRDHNDNALCNYTCVRVHLRDDGDDARALRGRGNGILLHLRDDIRGRDDDIRNLGLHNARGRDDVRDGGRGDVRVYVQ